MNNKNKEKLKVLIDTDPGHDDAMAILMVLANPDVEVVAITTVAGNSTIENVTRNAKFILDLARRSDIPVFDGAKKPLKKKLVLADVHGASGLDGSNSENQEIPKLKNNAVEKMMEIINQNPSEISILALGPLTNLAKMFLKDKTIETKIKQIVIMGGAINVAGNKSRVAEFNFFVDPESAKIVLESSVKKVLVPLDVCNEIIMQSTDIDLFGNGKIAKSLKTMLKPYIKNIAKFEGLKGAMMYDPLATYALVNPEAYKSEAMDVVVEVKGEFTAGMTVAEKRVVAKRSLNIEVVTVINGPKFLADFVDSIKKLDERSKDGS